jgi:glyoxylase-like metal-dependent hydrolase (beta-lactamase superfamily II)
MSSRLTLRFRTRIFAIPDEVKKDFVARKVTVEDWPLGSASNPEQELAAGVVLVPGRWNVVEIRQPDGIVIIEGPISNKYSALVMADAEKRFPGMAIKAVITTSDAWPHIGGLREYAARGIPIYALDLNRTILEKLFRAPHGLQPDALTLHPKRPKVVYVAAKDRIGSGSNVIELIPMRTVTGERQMVIYLPERKLLYSSDAFQRSSSGEFFLPQTLSEVVDVVQREGLQVDTDVGMHLGPTPWEAIRKAVPPRVE